jgi:8-oxo-dGTP pyrophosphatase MutT (NUDIX family)
MSHLNTNPGEHDHTASVYLFRTDETEPRVALHWHRKLHSYMQFGGHIEVNEHPLQTIEHELREESGYIAKQINILQPTGYPTSLSDSILHPQPALYSTHKVGQLDHFHTDITYAVVTDQPPRHQPEDGESTDIQLFTRQQIIDLPADKIMENVREIVLYMFDHCLPNWQATPLTKYL